MSNVLKNMEETIAGSEIIKIPTMKKSAKETRLQTKTRKLPDRSKIARVGNPGCSDK